MRQINQAGLDLIKSFEGCRLTVYNDIAGYPTVGFGHRTHLSLGNQVSQATADQWLLDDIAIASLDIEAVVKVPLNDNQFAALCSLVFNIGSGNFEKSTLLRELNDGNYDVVPSQLMLWTHAGGRASPGLERRRHAEAELWDTPIEPTPTDVAVGDL